VTGVHQRRLGFAVLSAVFALAAVAAAIAAIRGGGDEPPRAEAARLAPDTTLVFVDVSTDGDRPAVERASELLSRFGVYEAQRDALLKRLSGGDRPVDVEKDVEPWLGDEAALALTDNPGTTAGSLILIEVTDEAKAREFLARNPRKPARNRYKGDRIDEYPRGLTVAIKRGWLMIGQNTTVQGALDRMTRGGLSLAESKTYRRATRDLPDGRVATAYASADGLRRLLVPQGDVVGSVASFLDQPRLQGVGVSFEAREDGGRLLVRQALRAGGGDSEGVRTFEPALLGSVPQDAFAYLGVRGLSGPLANLLGSATGGSSQLLERLRSQLAKATGPGLQRDVLDLLKDEVAIALQPSTPAPVLSLVVKTRDEARTRRTLDRLRTPLARLLTPRGQEGPKWTREDVGGGVTAHTLGLPTGGAISYAVFDDRLVLSSSTAGIRDVRDGGDTIEDGERWDEVLADRPDEVGSLGFLDFSQLLELGEQTGLNDSRAYLAARDDLRKIRAVGVSSTGGEDETTAEILLSIP
jgi:hypothetical protein